MSLITCSGIAFAYEGNTVLKDVTFGVDHGDYLCIVGENGSGKTTLMKGLLGLLKPQAGSIKYSEGIKPNQIGYLPQQSAAQKDFPASVYEVVLSGRLSHRGIRPFYTKRDKEIAEQNMARLGVTDLKKQCYRELSGGQQQRVLLGRALCATDELLLLDEPVAGLDPLATQELYSTIEQINKQDGVTIIMISHDIHAAVRYANNILHLAGEQLFFGAVEDYKRQAFAKKFLGGDAA